MTHDPDGKPFTAYIGYVSLQSEAPYGVIDVDFVWSKDAAKDRLTLASLLLAGHFTREDVTEIRDAANDPENSDSRHDALRSIADRIESLLPPPEETPP